MRARELDILLYFAYGHNTNTQVMLKRCPSAAYRGVGELEGFRVVLRHYCDIEQQHGSVVEGVLWQINLSDLRALDHDEGLHVDYNRIPVEILTHTGWVRAMTYIMDPEHTQAEHQSPDSNYIESVSAGYSEHSLPLEQIGGLERLTKTGS